MSGMVPLYWALAIPLAGAVLIALLGRWPNVREAVTLATGVALFWFVASLVPHVLAGEMPGVLMVRLLPAGLSLVLRLEPLGMLFALVASGLWIVTSLYSIGYMRGHAEAHQTRFYVCFAVSISAAMGVALAGNLLTLFLFYEVLTLSTYPLVSHHGTPKAMRGARTYLGILVSTSVAFLLLAVAWTWVVAGTLDFRVGGILAGRASDGVLLVLLALFVFGTGKAALMPVHRWLPAAMVAPTPVSALLHAVAVVKAGVFTIMKVVIYIFGLDLLTSTGISVWLMYAAGFTVIAGSLVAMAQDNLKRRLAYSTVSQLSYIVLGAALANAWGVVGGSMHILMHAFGKITLFFCAGAIYVAAHKTEISDMRGLGRAMPITMAAFLIGALSVIGVPPLGGSWSKWYLALGALDAGQILLVAVLMVSSLLNIAYLVPIPIRAFFSKPADGSDPPRFREAPAFCVAALSFTALGCIVLFFFADDVYRLLVPLGGG
ncbi:MAG: monovalent cation/H+ antiporter subunit D family protein [Gemmatimonadales bacterium]|nr:monovalent cation/H+ antiporter subunit D family protein [Gemmatimonadales bacterium]MYG50471.1 monovalent cation/H+ antiporter subunit D family protein [Gemmatimonadales bacterium]MYK02988.1 monovalent cation/H+ antiporter subunit D family protein [Candidatus Palauibacter ramosifaciens]